MSRKHANGSAKTEQINLRTTPELRGALEVSASAADRSLAQEIEARIAGSYDPGFLLDQFQQRHGPRTARFLQTMARVLFLVGDELDRLPPELAQAGLMEACRVALNDAFPDETGALADVFAALREAGSGVEEMRERSRNAALAYLQSQRAGTA